MSWQVIRPQIVTLIGTVSQLEEVAPTPKIRFNGYPAAHVIPSEAASDYETTTENERQYAFTVRVFAETKNQGIEKAYLSLEEVVDAILDTVDQQDLGGSRSVGVGLPANYTYINIFAAPSRWVDFPDEELVMAEIVVKVRISIDVT